METIKIEWHPDPAKGSQGVIVGCDHYQEWLLPWWWTNFRLHNTNPVAFVDFNMSPKALEWCKQRGTIITLDLPDSFIRGKEEIDPKTIAIWEMTWNSPMFWHARKIWYKKPFALLQSPFEKTIWLDLDCQINNSLLPIYDIFLKNTDFAITPESEIEQKSNLILGKMLPGVIMYNAGVIGYRHGSKLLEQWAAETIEKNHFYFGDQQLLAHIIAQDPSLITPMPILFNWPAHYGINPYAAIIHWWGESKNFISMQLAELKKSSGIDLTL